MKNQSTYKAVFLIFIVLLCAWLIYKPGLNGGFIFDDYHSLQKLSVFDGEITDLRENNSLKIAIELQDKIAVAQQMIRNLRDSDNHICPCHENVDDNDGECTCHGYDEVIDYLNIK